MKGFDEKLVQAYYDYMVAIAVSLGADKTEAEIQLKESILFEIKLAKVSPIFSLCLRAKYQYIYIYFL